MLLQFNTPLPVPLHFQVPVDQTAWEPQSHTKTPTGWTPNRPRAPFSSWGKSLIPISQESQDLENHFGIYLFAINVPTPSLYVGIASNDTKRSEGTLTRLRKHRVKATGSHVGSRATNVGGVAHMKKWRDFAITRYLAMAGAPDTLIDVRFAVSKFVGFDIQRKTDLERFEASIISNQNGILDDIVRKLWPGMDSLQITLLNGTKGGFEMTPNDQIQLW